MFDGEIRWGYSPWRLDLELSDRELIYRTMNLFRAFTLGLAAFAVVWMIFSYRSKKNGWRVAVLVVSVLSLGLAFVP